MPIRIAMVIQESPHGAGTKLEVLAAPRPQPPVTAREERMSRLLAGAFQVVGESEAKEHQAGGRVIIFDPRPGTGPATAGREGRMAKMEELARKLAEHLGRRHEWLGTTTGNHCLGEFCEGLVNEMKGLGMPV